MPKLLRAVLTVASALVAFIAAQSHVFAGPSFTGVVNAASSIPPGLPNYGLAQGSVFVGYGAGLGPSTLVSASSLPLPTTAGLAGTSITVTVNGTTVTAPMIYSYQSQVAAILPSTTPVGAGTLTLTFNGASGSIPITVVASNFGISTVNQSGGGPGVITNPDYSLVTNAKSAKAGDVLIIWGTGLGPTSGSDAVIPVETDLGTPIQVFVGGVQANVLYRGRSSSPGLDQINITVPQGVTAGCFVSVVIQTGNLVSNNTSIPIAAAGGQCSDPVNPVTILSTLKGKASYKTGSFSLTNASVLVSANGKSSTTAVISANAAFQQYTQGQITAQAGSFPSLSSCLVAVSPAGTLPSSPASLNAGTAITLTPPSGAPITLPSAGDGTYSASLPSISSGLYQASNGAGGPDVGPFTVSFTGPTQPFVWTNETVATTAIDRTQPLTIQWSGGDPAGFVVINLAVEYIYGTSGYQVAAECAAPVSAGQFTVPPNVLLYFPGGVSGTTFSGSSFAVYGYSAFQPLTVPGLDLAIATTIAGDTVGSATYK
jgi:uncharacterized protein (TIGR03437 family)